MRIIIVCGNDNCRQEYKVETTDRFWECPHCGRKRESDNYPFLTAKFMQARIDGDNGDWETILNEALQKADTKVQENDLRIARLEHDAGVALEGEALASEHKAALKALVKKDESSEESMRKRAERFMKEARAIIVEQELRIKGLEEELQKKKKSSEKKKPASKGPVRKGKKELEEELIEK
jgi:hypothetical protein